MTFGGMSLLRWFERFGESLALVLVCIFGILAVSLLVTVRTRSERPAGLGRPVALLERVFHISCFALVADLAGAMLYTFGVVRFFRDDVPAWAEAISLLLYLGLIASVTALTGVLVIAALLGQVSKERWPASTIQ